MPTAWSLLIPIHVDEKSNFFLKNEKKNCFRYFNCENLQLHWLICFKKKRNFPYQSQLHALTVPIVKLDIMMLISWNPPFWHHNSFLGSLHLLTYLYTPPMKHHCLYCTFSLTLLFVFLEESIFRPDLPPVCYSLHFCRYWQNGVLKFFHRCCCNCFPMHTCIEDKIIRNYTFPFILGFGQIKLKQHLMPI